MDKVVWTLWVLVLCSSFSASATTYYVDAENGQDRFSRKAVRPPQMIDVNIPIAAHDRFLILMATDGLFPRGGARNPSAWDRCFFADPILELEASHND